MFLWVAMSASPAWAEGEARFALVIANFDYPAQPGKLKHPKADAARIAEALKNLGFRVTRKKNLSGSEITDAVDGLATQLRDAGPEAIGFFYYSGHGASAEVNGRRRNYLMPAKKTITTGHQLALRGVPLDQLVDGLATVDAQAVFFVSDACRNTLPWADDKGPGGVSKGFVNVARKSGLYLAFAAADGQTTPDDGFFSKQLAYHLGMAGVTADRAFTLAMRKVAEQRPGGRLPYVADGLTVDICFVDCGSSAEDAAWDLASGVGTSKAYEAFLERYPTGRRAGAAREALASEPKRREPTPSTRSAPRPSATASDDAQEAYDAGLTARRDGRDREAAGHYRRACDAGHAEACTNLGFHYEQGLGVDQDPSRAVPLYEAGCEGGNVLGCSNAAYLYTTGTGVAKDLVKARALNAQGCDAGDGRSCTNLGFLYSKGQDYGQARKYYRKGCDNNDGRGCTNLGVLNRKGLGGSVDFRRAMRLYEEGCSTGDPNGCTSVGLLYERGEGVDEDFVRARTWYGQACDAGHANGCSFLGDLVYYGKGGDADIPRGRGLVRQGCEMGDSWGCNWLQARSRKN